jgi:hypothetical protein
LHRSLPENFHLLHECFDFIVLVRTRQNPPRSCTPSKTRCKPTGKISEPLRTAALEPHLVRQVYKIPYVLAPVKTVAGVQLSMPNQRTGNPPSRFSLSCVQHVQGQSRSRLGLEIDLERKRKEVWKRKGLVQPHLLFLGTLRTAIPALYSSSPCRWYINTTQIN